MGLGQSRTTYGTGIPVFQHKILETAQSGGRLVTSGLVLGAFILAGTPVALDESNHTATIVKTAKLQAAAGSSATTIRVEKGHHFAVGDHIAKTIGGTAVDISGIDATNPAYDELTLSATLGTMAAGTGIFQAAAAGSNAVFAVKPTGLLYDDVKVSENQTLSVVIRGTALARRIPLYNAGLEAALPNIIFSQSH